MSCREGFLSLCLVLMALSASVCALKPEGWIPVLEETSVDVLQAKTENVMKHLHVAQRKIHTDLHDTQEALDSAEEELHCITNYYLPLLDARQRSYNAYRFYYLREKERAISELDRIEKNLTSMAGDASPQLVRELKKPLEIVADAKAAVLAHPKEAPELLRTLANKLNLMFLKIELVLQGTT